MHMRLQPTGTWHSHVPTLAYPHVSPLGSKGTSHTPSPHTVLGWPTPAVAGDWLVLALVVGGSDVRELVGDTALRVALAVDVVEMVGVREVLGVLERTVLPEGVVEGGAVGDALPLTD